MLKGVIGRCLAAVIAVITCFWAQPARASPEDLFGYGPRSPAMGGTGAASSDSYDAAYTNPALLSRIHRNILAVGYQGATFQLHASGVGLPGAVSALPARGIVVGAAAPLPFGGILKDRIAAGLAFYTPTDTILRARILFPETPDFPLLADRTQSLAARLGVGGYVGKGLSVGAGFAVLAELLGSIDVVAAPGNSVTANVQTQLVATYAPTFGAAYDLPFDRAPTGDPRWHVGLTWRGALDARFSVAVDASKLSTLDIPVFNIAGLAQYDPQEVTFEVAHERGDWAFAVGLTYKHWHAYPGVFEPTILCPATAPACGALTPPQIDFADTLVPRAGAERRFELPRGAVARLRAGFFLEPTPVPSSLPSSQAFSIATQGLVSLPTRFFDATRYVFSLGGGIDLGDRAPFTLDTYVQYHLLAETTVSTSPAPSATVSGSVLVFGLILGVRF